MPMRMLCNVATPVNVSIRLIIFKKLFFLRSFRVHSRFLIQTIAHNYVARITVYVCVCAIVNCIKCFSDSISCKSSLCDLSNCGRFIKFFIELNKCWRSFGWGALWFKFSFLSSDFFHQRLFHFEHILRTVSVTNYAFLCNNEKT